MHVFWGKGYEGAALSDLTRAMRINRPSLYGWHSGNKEQLFRKVLDDNERTARPFFRKLWRRGRRGMLSEQIFLGGRNMAVTRELQRSL